MADAHSAAAEPTHRPANLPADRPADRPADQSRKGFWQRLSYYAAGLGIGFIMMGLIQKGREAQLRQRDAADRAAASETQKVKDWGGFPPPVVPADQPRPAAPATGAAPSGTPPGTPPAGGR